MDPNETPFSKPKRVYNQIVRNLQWKDGTRLQGFRRLVEHGIQTGLMNDHAYFRYMRRAADKRMWGWIDGSDGSAKPSAYNYDYSGIPAMYDYTTAATSTVTC